MIHLGALLVVIFMCSVVAVQATVTRTLIDHSDEQVLSPTTAASSFTIGLTFRLVSESRDVRLNYLASEK